MNKTRERWAKIDAKYVSHKASTAHIQHLIEDAQADIEELYLRIAQRDALLCRITRHALHCGQTDYEDEDEGDY